MLVAPVLATCVFAGSSATASVAAVSIERVNGVAATTGEVRVSGGSMRAEGTAALPSPALIVDAGDSVVARKGERVTLSAFVSGADGTVRYAWSAPGGSFADAGGATVELDTTAMPLGPSAVRLTVTDTADGRSATDTVLISIGGPDVVLVDEERETGEGIPDEPPPTGTPLNTGGLIDGQSEEFPFEVPAGHDQLAARLDWSQDQNDFDMDLRGPSKGTSGATANKPEVIQVSDPAAGNYVVQVNPYLTTPDTYRLRVTMTPSFDDPRPMLTTAGPFRFEATDVQRLTSTASGGTAPYAIGWDLDMDGVFETAGPTATSAFPLGSHLVAAKVTDAAGFERREVTAVRVVAPGQRQDVSPFVVIAVNDSGINPYHDEFSVDSFPDPRVLVATANFTRHPSDYLPGYPKDAVALPISLDKPLGPAGAVPSADTALWSRTNVELGRLYWIPGTKIIGAIDHRDDSATDRRILDDDSGGHGTRSAGVAAGNVYGHCPMCLLVSEETLGGKYAYDKPWIDFVTNSWGSRGRVGSAGLLGESPPTAPKSAVERGQIALFSAGNGNENGFVTPNQTYGTGTSGPDWAVRVGAAERYSRKPIIGDGNPAEVSSFGDGYNPAADHLTTSGVANHSGTSAATPYTAGAFGAVLAQVRDRLADTGSGQRAGAAVATGRPVAGSPYLADGRLTRDELWDALFKTAEPDTTSRHSAFATTAPHSSLHYVFQGYGIVDSASAARATDVLLGRTGMPERAEVDQFLSSDSDLRRRTWGEWAGRKPAQASQRPEWAAPFSGPTSEQPTTGISSPAAGAVVDASRSPLLPVTGSVGPLATRLPGSETQRMWLRQEKCGTTSDNARLSVEDGADGGHGCSSVIEPTTMAGGGFYFADDDIFPAVDGVPVVLDRSRAVTGTIWIRGRSASPSHEISVELVSDQGIIGRQALAQPRIGESPTEFRFSFPVPERVAGRDLRKLTLTVRSERSLGLTSPSLEPGPAGMATQDWRSFVELPLAGPLAAPAEVAISVDGAQVVVTPVEPGGAWGDNIAIDELATGRHTVAAQLLRGGVAEGARGEVDIDVVRSASRPVVQVQLAPQGQAPRGDRWLAAIDTSSRGDWSTWSADVVLGGVRPGRYDLYSRLVVDGVEVARSAPAAIRRIGPLR